MRWRRRRFARRRQSRRAWLARELAFARDYLSGIWRKEWLRGLEVLHVQGPTLQWEVISERQLFKVGTSPPMQR